MWRNDTVTELSFLLLFIVGFSGCNTRNDDKELRDEQLTEVVIKAMGIRIQVHEKHIVRAYPDRVVVDINPEGRSVRQFSIATSMAVLKTYHKTFHFKNKAVLKYTTFTGDTPGSGGNEYRLKGKLTCKDQTFLIESVDQKEFGEGNPEFCLKYLSTLILLINTK